MGVEIAASAVTAGVADAAVGALTVRGSAAGSTITTTTSITTTITTITSTIEVAGCAQANGTATTSAVASGAGTTATAVTAEVADAADSALTAGASDVAEVAQADGTATTSVATLGAGTAATAVIAGAADVADSAPTVRGSAAVGATNAAGNARAVLGAGPEACVSVVGDAAKTGTDTANQSTNWVTPVKNALHDAGEVVEGVGELAGAVGGAVANGTATTSGAAIDTETKSSAVTTGVADAMCSVVTVGGPAVADVHVDRTTTSRAALGTGPESFASVVDDAAESGGNTAKPPNTREVGRERSRNSSAAQVKSLTKLVNLREKQEVL